MITKSGFLIDCPNKSHLHTELVKLIGWADIDFNILQYNYFSIDEYNDYIDKNNFKTDENLRWVELLKKIDFLYEVDFVTSLRSVESSYLPALTNLVSQILSQRLRCNVVSSFKPSSSDEDFPITHFSNGKEITDFSSFKTDCWNNVLWVKSFNND
ncbi:hypothetical protein C5E22_22305 [Pectobacterium parmentieri]|uniref:hypothetical protein n=1 Tax=Pectobacterium parmentieri TaxID=1905730 RepID=UPI000EB254FA|nr:hypothetical protein [Pectobacterium parmentieri]AYH07752.1 hypothetical protein C5E25_21650 [Pectobacterium parmentieri]AYH20946.1 hypothetical protein C5E22_22305 [Pectobacterium parmentieri]AYH25206.1 hypothetical protein C5E21_21275 [Pectobacterium parmentieri]MBN3177339.1 hypothetical protein [Pectobacterium parmentieri]QRN29839.1 hypothetical protein IG623_21760 [Pectobacterium parmentieri]